MSPRRLSILAALLGALYAIAHALDLRPYAAILSGTAPPGGDGAAGVVLGLVYVGLHFACVIGAPILIIAALISWSAQRWIERRGR